MAAFTVVEKEVQLESRVLLANRGCTTAPAAKRQARCVATLPPTHPRVGRQGRVMPEEISVTGGAETPPGVMQNYALQPQIHHTRRQLTLRLGR
jgi:hypothetical protein